VVSAVKSGAVSPRRSAMFLKPPWLESGWGDIMPDPGVKVDPVGRELHFRQNSLVGAAFESRPGVGCFADFWADDVGFYEDPSGGGDGVAHAPFDRVDD